ncbi:MAG TPA: hypothetical protein VNK70_01145 [Candidatus Paceibacterota bacterium]|nr:hypothetical protein [Candidatus Paceibacterota bacterium]
MKLIKNPFFYLNLVLFLVVAFQVARFVGAVTYTEPTTGFSGGNPPPALIKTDKVDQDSGGNLSLIGGTVGSVTLGESRIVFNGTALYGSESNTPSLAFVPRDSNNNTKLYFGSTGTFYIKNITDGDNYALAISKIDTNNYSLDFSGSINARSLCFSGDCKSSWAAVGGGTTSGQWTLVGNDLRYSAGNVIVDKYLVEDQGSYADGLTGEKQVCVDDRPGLIYEKNGSIATVYVSGHDSSSNLSSGWEANCDTDVFRPYKKVQFLSWNWEETSDESVNVTLARSRGDCSPFTISVNYDRNTVHDTRSLATRACTASGAQLPYLILGVKWSKPAPPSHKKAYENGTAIATPISIVPEGFLRLRNVSRPDCPGPAGSNLGLVIFSSDKFQVCTAYDTSDGQLFGWRAF